VNITPKKGLNLPESSALTDPVDVVKLIVAEDGVFVEDKKVMELNNGRVPASIVDRDDPSFLKSLYQALDERAKQAKTISKLNDSFEFDGKVLMQADRNLPYEVLQKVMYTSMLAGYSDVKLAVVQK
jgi:biopolymer transport protein ExbD